MTRTSVVIACILFYIALKILTSAISKKKKMKNSLGSVLTPRNRAGFSRNASDVLLHMTAIAYASDLGHCVAVLL